MLRRRARRARGRPRCRGRICRRGRAPLRRYVGSVSISAERYSGDFAKVAQEVLANLVAAGADVTISLSVDAVSSSGFTEKQVRTIRENASTLKFSTNAFEQD